MGNREQATAAALELGGADLATRRRASQTLHQLARQRTSLLWAREALLAALDDADGVVRAEAALALLVDAWRFAGLLPVVDELQQRLTAEPAGPALGAAVGAARDPTKLATGTAALVQLLAADLPASALLLARLAGQGADLRPALGAIAGALDPKGPPAGQDIASLWLSALGRVDTAALGPHLDRLRQWMDADSADWRYDDLRYRAAGLVVCAALGSQDAAQVRQLAASPHAPLREATLDTLTSEWLAGGRADLAAELLQDHVLDPAGGVRYAAIRGLARAAAAGVALPIRAEPLLEQLPTAQYLSTGWTYPLDTTAVSDLRSESAAADLATVLAVHARRTGDGALRDRLLADPQPEVVAAARAVLDAPG